MNWKLITALVLAGCAIGWLFHHGVWPGRPEVVEIPGEVVIDSTRVKALELELATVQATLQDVQVSASRDHTALGKARALYAELERRLEELEDSLASGSPPDLVDWPAAVFDTTAKHITGYDVAIGDSTEHRDVMHAVRIRGEHVLPPYGFIRNMSITVTPSSVFFARQLPGSRLEVREVIRWEYLAAAGGVGAAIAAIIAIFASG